MLSLGEPASNAVVWRPFRRAYSDCWQSWSYLAAFLPAGHGGRLGGATGQACAARAVPSTGFRGVGEMCLLAPPGGSNGNRPLSAMTVTRSPARELRRVLGSGQWILQRAWAWRRGRLSSSP